MVFGATLLRGLTGTFAGVATASVFSSATAEAASEKKEPIDDFTAFINAGASNASSDLCHEKTWGVPWIADWDNPMKRGTKARSSRIKRQVLLIRHGQYQNEKTKCDDSMRTLTPLGERQAKATGEYLRKLFDAKSAFLEPGIADVKNFYVSDMTRAKQTAELLIEGMFPGNRSKFIGRKSAQVDSVLRERFPCNTEPPSRHKAHLQDIKDAEEAFSRYFHRPMSDEPSCDVIVCHANVIRYFVCRALQVPPEAWLRYSLPHASVTSIVMGGSGNVKVSTVGSAFHLDAVDVTYSNLP